MKEKTIEKLEPIKTRKQGLIGTIQKIDDIYIVNIFFRKQLHYKYCLDTRTKEYKTLDVLKGIWEQKKFMSLVDAGYQPGAYWRTPHPEIKFDSDTTEFLNKVNEALKEPWRKRDNLVDALDVYELESGREKRETVIKNKSQKILEMEMRTPRLDEKKVREWAIGMINPQHYLLKTKEGCSCTSCGSSFEMNTKRGKTEECPQCKAILKVKNVTPETTISTKGMISIIQETDFETIVRHIDCEVKDVFGQKRDISFNEAVRVVVDLVKRKGQFYERTHLYYSQINKRDYYSRHFTHRSLNLPPSLWDTNPCNRKMTSSFLYPEGIECLDRTNTYKNITKLLQYMADQGIEANYNRIMYANEIKPIMNTIEYLAKGRFYRLVDECSNYISMWNKSFDKYYTCVQPGDDIHETLGLCDKQLINRLREKNGGNNMLNILQWVDQEGLKIPDEALTFLEKEKIKSRELMKLTEKINITPIAIVNYLKKQKAIYKTRSYQGILDQWIDYLGMMDRLGKKYTDELFYKPKDLKKRHDELVEEINTRARELELKDNVKIAKQQAKEYREKFPQAEKILKDIKPKFEYTGENMSILVPKNLSEIIADGRTLHHCAGATNRYFDRIQSKETFICFLRKNDSIEIPYYTIEVEPGGTIRQHRGMYDEEPELETVKPFLKEWQKEIKKRMSQEDKKLAKISKIKREANIEDLKAKNNTFVLKGLMEDFMEA